MTPPAIASSWTARFATLWLIVALACGAWAGHRLLTGKALETNLLALLPTTERNPRAETAVNVLAESLGNRAVFLVGHADPGQAHAAARRFAEALRASQAFRQVNDEAPRADIQVLTDLYAPHRFSFLTDADRRALQDPDFDADKRLARRLHQPLRFGIATDPGSDPYGLLQNWLGSLPLMQTALTVEDGQLTARDGQSTWVVILAELAGSSYDNLVQNTTLSAYAQAQSALARDWPQASVLRTGGVFYGAAARESAQQEMDYIGAGSLIGILLLLWWLFRSPRPVALCLLTVALGIAVATAAVLATYGNLHLITLVFGASLIGEAVDYSIQFFAAQLEAGRQWQAHAALRRLLRPLAIALATSLIGYAALALTPFPAIGQIALFAFAGLASAWLSVVLLLPFLSPRPLTRDVEAALRWPRAFLDFWRRHITPRKAWQIVALALFASLPGWMNLSPDDDIRQLISRPPQLVADETKIRELAGLSGSGRFFLVEGRNSEELLQREEALAAALKAAPGIARLQAVSAFVPSSARQAENLALVHNRLFSPPEQAIARLSEAGLRDDIAAALVDQATLATQAAQSTNTTAPLNLEAWLANPLSTPWRYLVLPGQNATLVIPQGDDGKADLAALADGLPGVTLVNKAGSVTRLFQQYRQWGSLWLPVAAFIILGILAWRYGLRNGAIVLLPNLLGTGLALACYGYLGLPLTLFGLMGLMLVLGVGVNYAIFIVEAGDRAPAPFAGALLSAATTLLAFGLLSFSSMPALQHFGSMLMIGVAASVLLAPLALTLWKHRCA